MKSGEWRVESEDEFRNGIVNARRERSGPFRFALLKIRQASGSLVKGSCQRQLTEGFVRSAECCMDFAGATLTVAPGSRFT